MALTARGERTKKAFRDAAKQVIAQKGFLRMTISDVAAAAKRSPASFYNYYESKEDLLAELADEFRADTERARPTFKLGTPTLEIMHESARAYWMSYKAHLAELVGVFQVAMVDESFAERWREIRLEGIVTIREGIERAQARGYCPGADPWLLAGALGSMFEHFCYVSLAQGGAFTQRPFDEEDAIRTIAQVWYHSVYWKPAAVDVHRITAEPVIADQPVAVGVDVAVGEGNGHQSPT
ncbi:MAG: TetR/AcrR family transcriptional regulator [Ilumatobacteraceae bacterium]